MSAETLFCIIYGSAFLIVYLVVLLLHAVSYYRECTLARELKKDLLVILSGVKNVNRA